MATCHQGRDTEIDPKFKIVITYWHDHSLKSSWGALSDGTIHFSIQQFSEEKNALYFSEKTSVLKDLRFFLQ
jgi:hypothetical protein